MPRHARSPLEGSSREGSARHVLDNAANRVNLVNASNDQARREMFLY